jgi:GT2 family glycosyltransferase
MTPAAARVAIVLVNWKGWRDSIECLSSIVGSGALEAADVWLVDNASGDGSVAHIEAWCGKPVPGADWRPFDGVRHAPAAVPIACRVWHANGQPAPLLPGVQVNLVHSGGNLGFAGGNNAGITAAGLHRYSHVWLLNNDTVMARDALAQLLLRADADERTGIVGSTLLHYSQPDSVQALGGGWFDRGAMRMSHIGEFRRVTEVPASAAAVQEVEAQMAYVVGASMLVKSGFIEDVGPMCEDYFLYFEELDWAFRGQPRWALGYAPGSRIFHKVGASSSQTVSEFSLNLLYRNQVRFASRFLPERLPALKRSLALELLRHVLKGRWMPARLVARTLAQSRALAASAPPLAGHGA